MIRYIGVSALAALLVALGACEKADPAQKLFERGLAAYDPEDRAEAIKLYDQACELNHANACAELGYAYYGTEDQETTDLTKSLAAFERSCELLSGDGCVGGAGWWSLESEEEPKYELIIPFLVKGCEFGSGLACNDLGNDYIDGKGVEADPKKGRELQEKACSLGDAEGCYDYGILLRDAIGGWVDFEKARTIFYESCHEHDMPKGCSDYGEMLLTGDGGEKDIPGAIEYFKKACDAELNYACTNVGVVYADETTGVQDEALATDFAIRGCELGHAKGCAFVAESYEMGLGREKDDKLMKSYRKKACVAGGDFPFCPDQ